MATISVLNGGSTCRVRSTLTRRAAPRLQATIQNEQRAQSEQPHWQWIAGIATAAYLTAMPVHAGVILEQPKLKKLDAPAEAKVERSSKKESSSSSGLEFGLDLGLLSLPLTAVGCAGLYIAGSRLDSDFDRFMDGKLLKDSDAEGIGYEEIYKATDYTRGGKSPRR